MSVASQNTGSFCTTTAAAKALRKMMIHLDVHEDLAPALHGYADAREGALARAYEGLHEAEARSDQVAIKIVTMMQSTC